MSSSEAIGGYFELELSGGGGFPHGDAILLNSGRACFEYILRAAGTRRVHLPKYTCDVMLEPLEKLGIPWTFYAIDENLEIAALPDVGTEELLVYTNYFGVKDRYCRELAARFGARLVLDCSQAYLFAPPASASSFYSPRKFLGLPDGGCLYTGATLDDEFETDGSLGRMSHLLARIEQGPEAGYPFFKANDASLSGEPIRLMSALARRILESVDHDALRRRRAKNFASLHELIGASNRLEIAGADATCPMVYPYLGGGPELRRKLIDNRIFVATYWPNVLEWSRPGEIEHALTTDLLPIPIDQRYGREHMERIASIVG